MATNAVTTRRLCRHSTQPALRPYTQLCRFSNHMADECAADAEAERHSADTRPSSPVSVWMNSTMPAPTSVDWTNDVSKLIGYTNDGASEQISLPSTSLCDVRPSRVSSSSSSSSSGCQIKRTATCGDAVTGKETASSCVAPVVISGGWSIGIQSLDTK